MDTDNGKKKNEKQNPIPPKIILWRKWIKIEKNEIVVMYEIKLIKEGIIAEGETIVSRTNPETTKEACKIKNSEEAIIEHRFPREMLGEEVEIKFELESNRAIEQIERVVLLAGFGSGLSSMVQNIMYNIEKKQSKIAWYVIRTFVIVISFLCFLGTFNNPLISMLVSILCGGGIGYVLYKLVGEKMGYPKTGWVLLAISFLGFVWLLPAVLRAFDGTSFSVLFGILFGYLLYRIARPNKKLGYVLWISIVVISYYFTSNIVGSFTFVAGVVLISLLAYLAEEATYQISIFEEGGKEKIKFEKFWNFYPMLPLIIIAIAITAHILLLISSIIASVISPGVPMHGAGMTFSLSELNNQAYGRFNDILGHMLGVINWSLAAIILFAYAMPGEFIDLVKGQKSVMEMGRLIEKSLFLSEAVDIIRRLFRRVIK